MQQKCPKLIKKKYKLSLLLLKIQITVDERFVGQYVG